MESEAGVALLASEHKDAKSPDGNPVVGWKQCTQGKGSLFNPNGWAALRVVTWKMIEGVRQWLYDQIMIVENPGVYVVVRWNDKIGLVYQFRMVGDRLLSGANREYVRMLNHRQMWTTLLEGLGRKRWEVPAGFFKVDAGVDLEEAVVAAARVLVAREAGYVLKNVEQIGQINANPVFFPHAQYVVLADLDSGSNATPDAREIIGGERFFTHEEIRQLVKRGTLDDARTIAALALCGVSFVPVERGSS